MQELVDHFHQLCATFNVPVDYVPDDVEFHNEGLSMALVHPKHKEVIYHKSVLIKPITDECRYAVAMHELGHCVQAFGISIIDEMEKEELAWEWARHYALIWTVAMDQVEKIGLDSHREIVRLRAVRAAQEERDAVARSTQLRGFIKRIK